MLFSRTAQVRYQVTLCTSGGTMHLFLRFSLLALLILLSPLASKAADIPRFDITRYQVEGNSILTPTEVAQILAPFTGKACDFGTLQQAVERLEQSYRKRGYHAVKVLLPEQELQGGVVRLSVIEVRIGTVMIDGNKHFDNDNIRRSIPELKEGTVPNLDKISMGIRLANENPARKTQLILDAGNLNDTTNARLQVTDQRPWNLRISLDNTGTDETGDIRLGFLAQHANLFNLDHLLSLQYTTSIDHPDKVNIYSLGYHVPLYSWGDSLDIYGGYSDVDSGTVQSGILSLNVSGKGTFAGARFNQNLTRVGSYEHRLLYGFDYRRYENDSDYAGTSLGSISEALLGSIGYSGSKAMNNGIEFGGWLSVSQSIPGVVSRSDSSDYEQVRVDSSAGFTLLRAGANALYAFPGEFQGRFVVAGQYSWEPLIPGEQFGMGGQGSVRGFVDREFADDIGAAGSLEIYTPNILKLLNVSDSLLKALVFYDAGYLERNKPQPGEEKSRNAASTGFGFRLAIDRHLFAGTDCAFVLDPLDGYSYGSSRWHFKVIVEF